MSVEELMKPRYKVIADYPGSRWKVNQILHSEDYCFRYPHLFRKLEWWEERKPEDLPKYVKENIALTLSEETPRVFKLEHPDGEWFIVEVKPIFRQYSLTVYLPATKSEYLKYNQSIAKQPSEK